MSFEFATFVIVYVCVIATAHGHFFPNALQSHFLPARICVIILPKKYFNIHHFGKCHINKFKWNRAISQNNIEQFFGYYEFTTTIVLLNHNLMLLMFTEWCGDIFNLCSFYMKSKNSFFPFDIAIYRSPKSIIFWFH